jgi:hypothetical protein
VVPEQQPVGQTEASHPHAPFTHRWVAGHAWQASPPVPHASFAEPGRQLVPEQQPVRHESPSQTQAPPEQRWPAPHAAVAPQAQAPPTQPSAFCASQATHAAPAAPHAATEAAVHTPPAQHPAQSVPHTPPAASVTTTSTW